MKAFDRVLKVLARDYADAFLQLVLPDVPLELVGVLENVELTVPEGRVDFVHRVLWEEQEYLLHIEFQVTHRADFPKRMFVYSALLTKQMDLPVITLVIYLAPRKKPLPTAYEVNVDGVSLNRFEYQVVRLWEYTDEIAAGKWPELAPLLAMLVDEPDTGVLVRERELILRERDERKRADLLACAITIGSRYFDKEFLWRFFREEVELMREVSFIDEWLQEKLEEGRIKGLQQGIIQGLQEGREKGILEGKEIGFHDGRRASGQSILLRILHRRFGEVPLEIITALTYLTPEQLEDLVDVAISVSNSEDFAEAVRRLPKGNVSAVPA